MKMLVTVLASLLEVLATAMAQQRELDSQSQGAAPDAVMARLQQNYAAMSASVASAVANALSNPRVQASILQEFRTAAQNQFDLSAKLRMQTPSEFDKAFHPERIPTANLPRTVELLRVTNTPPTLRRDPNDLLFPIKSTLTVTFRINDRFGEFTVESPVAASEKGVWKEPSSGEITQQIKAQCDAKARQVQSVVDEKKRRYDEIVRELGAKLSNP